MKSPFLTVIVPMYNVEAYIEQCLHSLLNQSYSDFKVIVVDDGSKDNSAVVAKKYAHDYPERFTYFYQENKGLGAARNSGMKLVTTDFIAFLDSDDWWMPRTAERLHEALMRETEQPDIIFMTPTVYSMATMQFTEWMDKPILEHIFAQDHICTPREHPEMYSLEANICRSVWRSAFLKNHNFEFPVGVKWEDVFPHFYLFYWARNCIAVPDCGFVYRVSSGNQITSLSDESRLDTIKVFAKTLTYALENNWRKDEVAYIIDMMMSFTRWAFDVSKPEVMKKMIPQAHKLCCAIPSKYVRTYKEMFGQQHHGLWMMLSLLRKPIGYQVFENYHLVDACKKVRRRLLRK